MNGTIPSEIGRLPLLRKCCDIIDAIKHVLELTKLHSCIYLGTFLMHWSELMSGIIPSEIGGMKSLGEFLRAYDVSFLWSIFTLLAWHISRMVRSARMPAHRHYTIRVWFAASR